MKSLSRRETWCENWSTFTSTSTFAFAFTLLSSAQWALRRNRLIAVMTVMNIFFVGFGLLAKMSLNYCGLIMHSTYMISIIGGFYIYIMINFLIK